MWSWGFLISGFLLALLYLLFAVCLLEEVNGRVYLTGFALSSEAAAEVKDKKGPKNTTKDLLDSFGYESEERIWAGRWFAKLLLFILFTLASAAIAGGLSLLLVANIVHERALAAGGNGALQKT